MTNQEAISIIKTAIANVEWDYPMDYAAAFDMAIKALELLKAQEPKRAVCEKCGLPIDHIVINEFFYDGSDAPRNVGLIWDDEHKCAMFSTSQNWCGYELSDEERKEDIRCPECGKYPFDDDCEIDFCEPVEVIMFGTNRPADDEMKELEQDG